MAKDRYDIRPATEAEMGQLGLLTGYVYGCAFGDGEDNTVKLPTGCSIFPKEIVPTPRRWAETRYKNIVYWNELDKGGHFAAFEQPELFVEELRACFALMR